MANRLHNIFEVRKQYLFSFDQSLCQPLDSHISFSDAELYRAYEADSEMSNLEFPRFGGQVNLVRVLG